MSERTTGASLVIETLEQYGVPRVFGNPGTTELPLVRAISESDLEYVLCLHEDIAVGAAAGYATARRERYADRSAIGVVNLHATPGLAHGLGNLYGAWMAGAPILVTAGLHSTDFQHAEPKLSGDVVGMADQFTKWSAQVTRVEALPAMLRRAIRTALTPPTGPVFIEFPLDVLQSTTDSQPEPLGPIPDAGTGDPDAINCAASLLEDANDVAVVVGDHAAASPDIDQALDRFVSATGARVHTEMLTSAVAFPFGHDRFDSPLLPDERAATQMAADAVVWIACSTNTTLTRPDKPLVAPKTTSIHLGPDPGELGKTVPVDVAVIGDPQRVVASLADQLEGKDPEPTPPTAWNNKYPASDSMDMASEADHLAVREVISSVRSAVPDALVVDESSSNKYEVFREWPLAPGQYIGNKGAGLGYSLPVAIGAAIAEHEHESDCPVVCFIGDGSYLYYPGAMYTAANHGLDIRVIVFDNGEYRILEENAEAMFDESPADYELVGTEFNPSIDIAADARAYGVEGQVVKQPEVVSDTVNSAGPCVIDVLLTD